MAQRGSVDDRASCDSTPEAQPQRRLKRIQRACDKCSTLRTRCDGHTPCVTLLYASPTPIGLYATTDFLVALEYHLVCAYTRVRRRRGRTANVAKTTSLEAVTQDHPPQNQDTQQSLNEPDYREVENVPSTNGNIDAEIQPTSTASPGFSQRIQQDTSFDQSEAQEVYQVRPNEICTDSNGQYGEISPHDVLSTHQLPAVTGGTGGLNLDPSYQEWPSDDNLQVFTREAGAPHTPALNQPPLQQQPVMNTLSNLAMSDLQTRVSYQPPLSPLVGLNGPDATSYARTPPSPFIGLSTSGFTPQDDNLQAYRTDTGCRYPVLLSLIPYVRSFIPTKELCNLLDLYFTEPSNSLFECSSPYVLTQIIRKKSLLRKDRPRKTSPALLAAMVWVTAQTSDAQFFKTSARVRASICDQLLRVCFELLDGKDLEERPWSSSTHACSNQNRSQHSERKGADNTPDERVETVDDVLTLTLIGTVVSGGHIKRESTKWWASAWSLAKKLELNREVDDVKVHGKNGPQEAFEGEQTNSPQKLLELEEAKEERRRTWWLLYITDRHLSLAFNARLSILDAECHIYQPLDERTWQDLDLKPPHEVLHRSFSPSTTITGVGFFEYFLPLMSILGDVVEVHHLTCHPRFGLLDLGAAIAQVESSLDTYEGSLRSFEESSMFNVEHFSSSQATFGQVGDSQGWSVERTRQKLVIAYCKHLVHVLHILLHGCWDPMRMLDDGMEQWVTPDSFFKCATHAISAATAVSEIMCLDPELSFMPYLFGIYLLHGSFILLIFADRMDMSTSDAVIEACETIIRAHEVCITTLNTEYQRNFRKVLRSALNNVRGTTTVDHEQHKSRRRELLSMFQWTKDGKGLLA
ncbi:Xylanolytic transcriptional activator [Lachnellula subtilissima]|uniref:Xylanolytic transcriptional activator n=1 Tax=Lachnellula subtilissima TaxID=602034 RepID=A0A8H8S1L7_9HELO|nr:Xylanolytic transcriptional activator [Lachnellula subtilissima]